MEFKDYYKILGVDKNASEKDIKHAYRRLARQHHPDVNRGDPTAEQRFKEINEANDVLSDKEKRSRYDQLGANWDKVGPGFDPSRAGGGWQQVNVNGVNLEDLLGGRFRTGRSGRGAPAPGGDFSEFFRMFFGGQGQAWEGDPGTAAAAEGFTGYHPPGAPGRGQSLELELPLSLEDAIFGTRTLISLQREDPCPECGGTGISKRQACRRCQRQGRIVTPRRLEVKVPPGVRDGSRIRVAGEGSPGSGGGEAGDLFLIVKLSPHPVFEVRGNDLHLELPVTVTEAVLGAEVEVPVLKGQVTMKVPPETSAGKTLRLRGQGLPGTRGAEPGDLYVHIRIVAPEHLSPDEQALYSQLAQLRHDNPRSQLLASVGRRTPG